MHVTLSSQ